MKLLLLVLSIAFALAHNSLILEFSDGYNQFAINVYKELRKLNFGNLLVCPLSVEVILALVQVGARGITAQQLAFALHLPNDRTRILEIFEDLTPYFKANDGYDLVSANKVYVKHGFKIREKFKAIALSAFGAELQNIDFGHNNRAALEINNWVEDKTFQKITNVVSSEELDTYTRIVLINALYFHGKWVTPFEERFTKKARFSINSLDEVIVDMMETYNRFNYYESYDLKAKFLELPYEGNQISMVIVLPFDIDGLPELEDRIANVFMVPNFRQELVEVKLPKFKIETSIKFKPILENLGVVDAFKNSANFSGIFVQRERIKVNNVFQKVFIDVTEKGTTAAATSVAIGAARTNHVLGKKFIANHPFMFYLKSRSLGIIFIGRFLQG